MTDPDDRTNPTNWVHLYGDEADDLGMRFLAMLKPKVDEAIAKHAANTSPWSKTAPA